MTDRMSGEAWWREAVIYQIYPRSWRDEDGDGVGDLPGIEARLDHLVRLGVDAVWISPFYPSPMADFGYDVSDYEDVDPLFGTLADFDALAAAAHGRRLKVILDFVPNHSSDRHPWFRESRSSRESAKRDWYIWKDPGPDGGPPTNWQSSSGGSAWAWDEATSQYYLHTFLPEQPDLNWRKPEVREAMLGAMRFWFERGVDGFRLDVIYHCIKDARFRDDPENPDHDPETDPPFGAVIQTHSSNQPEVLPLVVEPMRRLAEEMGGRLLIGEIYLPFEKLVRYYGADGSGVHLPFNFSLISADWTAPALKALIEDYESHLPEHEWPNWVLGNHDQSRIATRIGPDRARLAAILLLAGLRGTPTLYYGDEIGMRDVEIQPDRIRDPWERNMPGLGEGRDPCRTPMLWTDARHAGFCPPEVEPWLPFGDRPPPVPVAEQWEDPDSMLRLHADLLRLRRAHPALRLGRYEAVEARGPVLTIVRATQAERVVVALNLSDAPTQIPVAGEDLRPLLTVGRVEGAKLPPFGALVAGLGPAEDRL